MNQIFIIEIFLLFSVSGGLGSDKNRTSTVFLREKRKQRHVTVT